MTSCTRTRPRDHPDGCLDINAIPFTFLGGEAAIFGGVCGGNPLLALPGVALAAIGLSGLWWATGGHSLQCTIQVVDQRGSDTGHAKPDTTPDIEAL